MWRQLLSPSSVVTLSAVVFGGSDWGWLGTAARPGCCESASKLTFAWPFPKSCQKCVLRKRTFALATFAFVEEMIEKLVLLAGRSSVIHSLCRPPAAASLLESQLALAHVGNSLTKLARRNSLIAHFVFLMQFFTAISLTGHDICTDSTLHHN